MNPYRRYSTFLLVFFLSQSVAIGLLNALADPYQVFESPKIERFNKSKPEVETHLRLFKAIAIARQKPNVIFLGSSRTELGLDPTHPVFAHSGSVYNLGISGPNMYEVMRYFQHALKNQPQITQVVLGIDFFMFNEFRNNRLDFSETRLEKENITLSETLAVLFSFDALESTAETISTNFKDPDRYDFYNKKGMRNLKYQLYYRLPSSRVKSFKFSLQEYLKDVELYKSYRLSPEFLKNLEKIVELCREKNIELKIFISPSHATQWEAIYQAGLWPVFEQWKREVVKIAPVWDFSGYNPITIEPVSNSMKNYVDSSHYTPRIGNVVINRMFSMETKYPPESKDFGQIITPENIEKHLRTIRKNREQWKTPNVDWIEFLKETIKKSQTDSL